MFVIAGSKGSRAQEIAAVLDHFNLVTVQIAPIFSRVPLKYPPFLRFVVVAQRVRSKGSISLGKSGTPCHAPIGLPNPIGR